MALITRNEPRTDATSFNRKLFAPMILGSILNPINSSMIAVSLVPIGIAFGAPPSQTAWLISALYLATATGQPVVGRLVDMFGPRRLFLAGTALTGIAGVLGLLAPSFGVLVVARVILGFGTCAGYPAAMYLIRSEAKRTGQDSPAGVLTALAVSSQTIAVVGPTLGGLLIGFGGWRTIFAVNIPLAIAGIVLGLRRLPKHDAAETSETRNRIDVIGMVLFAGMLTALLLFLMNPRIGDWYLLVLTLAAGVALALRELRTADPFIDLRVLAGNLPLLATYVRNLLSYIVSYAFLYGYTQWLEGSRGLSASQSGLILLGVFGTALIVSSTTGRRKEIRGKLVVGSIAQVVMCLLLLPLHATAAIWLLVLVAAVAGIPSGLNSLANQNAVYFQADPARMGSSAGLLRTFMYVGAMIASAANAAFFGHGVSDSGLHHLSIFLLGVAVVFLVVTLADRSLRRVGNDPSRATAGADMSRQARRPA